MASYDIIHQNTLPYFLDPLDPLPPECSLVIVLGISYCQFVLGHCCVLLRRSVEIRLSTHSIEYPLLFDA